MLVGISFESEKFDKTKKRNIFGRLTENTIVICRNFDMMKFLAQEIVATVNEKIERNYYYCEDEDVGKAKYGINNFLTTEIYINNQKIVLCLEPAMVYRAKDIKDIWFFDTRKVGDAYLYFLIPFYAYKGSENTWEKGLTSVYAQITLGRYAGYNGEWIDDNRVYTSYI